MDVELQCLYHPITLLRQNDCIRECTCAAADRAAMVDSAWPVEKSCNTQHLVGEQAAAGELAEAVYGSATPSKQLTHAKRPVWWMAQVFAGSC